MPVTTATVGPNIFTVMSLETAEVYVFVSRFASASKVALSPVLPLEDVPMKSSATIFSMAAVSLLVSEASQRASSSLIRAVAESSVAGEVSTEGSGLGVGEDFGAGVGVGVGLGFGVGDGLGVGLGFGVGVGDGFAVAVAVGIGFGVGVGDGFAVAVAVGVGFGVDVAVALGVGRGVGDGFAVEVGRAVGVAVARGFVPEEVASGLTVG
jgi:hypothetical protein